MGAAKVDAAPASPEAQAPKRPADGQAGGAKKAKGDSSEQETLARMLAQGVARVLQNRQKAGKGALPVSELEEEFKALWKVPFNLQQAGETDAVTFLRKWPNKVEVFIEDGVQKVQLSLKKVADKAEVAKASTAAAPAVAAPKEVAQPKRPAPTRPPASIEDLLWNLHTVLEAHGEEMPIDQFKDAYSKHLGHKCAIERFLVVGEGGLAATLKRIPHIVSVVPMSDGSTMVRATLPAGTTKEALVAADNQYRRQLQRKAAPPKGPEASAAARPAAPAPAAQKAAAPAAAPAAPAAPKPAAPPATAAKAPALAAATAVAGQKRPAEAAPGGAASEPEAKKPNEPDAKKPREDADTLARMLVQGVARVLQNRQKEGKGSLPLGELEDEFKALWKVPFNLQQAGETDAAAFLQKWPNKVEVLTEGGQIVVQAAKKGADKAKAGAKAAPAPAAGVVVPEAAPAPATTASAAPAVVAAEPAAEAGEEAPASPAADEPRSSAGTTQAAPPATSTAESAKTLAELREQAASMLSAMKDMVRQQEGFVEVLQRMGETAA